MVEGNELVARSLAQSCEVVSLPVGTVLIRQGDADNDIYFILAGRVRILVNEREVATRTSCQHVGDMAMVDASSQRTATVVSIEPTVVARVSESVFTGIANAHPPLWRSIAVELVRRLDERRKFHQSPNDKPILFIGSSRESLVVAKALAEQISTDVASVRLWSEGVFGASHFPIEDLASLLQCSDYAALVASADDMVTSRGKESQAPRDNIVFELGLFMGALTRYRTFLVVPRGIDIKIPTDLLGINCVAYDLAAPTPQAAAQPAANEIVAAIHNGGPK
jgi:predicted nucleotide-binding protein